MMSDCVMKAWTKIMRLFEGLSPKERDELAEGMFRLLSLDAQGRHKRLSSTGWNGFSESNLTIDPGPIE